MLSNSIKINRKNKLICNYYWLLIYDNIQKLNHVWSLIHSIIQSFNHLIIQLFNQFSIFCHRSSIYAFFGEAAAILGLEWILWVIATTSDWVSSNHTCCQLITQQQIILKPYTIEPLTSRSIYFFSDLPHLSKTVRKPLCNSGFGKSHTLYRTTINISSGDNTTSLQQGSW